MPGMSDCPRAARLVVSVVAAGALAGCVSPPSKGAPDPVTIGIAEPARLLPSSTVDADGTQVIAALWTPLVTFDPGGKPVMAAAESITSSDQKVWTITLRSGWTFHNGESVTSDNYIKAWNNAAYGPNAAIGSPNFWRIEGYADMQSVGGAPPKATTLSGLRKVDDLTFTTTLASPFSAWETALGNNVFDPLPDAAFDRQGRITKDFEQAPIGQGPFQMDGVWNHYRSIAVKRFSHYNGTRPTVSTINFTMYQDQTAMYDDLIAGRLDVQSRIPPSKLASAPDDLGDRLRRTPSSYIGFITVPNDNPAYTTDIRRAISMGFDRRAIANEAFHGTVTPATSWISPTVPGYRADTCGQYCDYDPTAARSLWTRAGGVPGNKIVLYYDSDDGHGEWGDAVCDQLAATLNVDCHGETVAQVADAQDQTEAQRRITCTGWSFDYPSMEDYLRPLYATGARGNNGGYANPRLDAALASGDAASTQEAALTAYQAAEDIVASDLPVIPTWFGQNVAGYSTRMSHVDVDARATVDLVTLATR